MRAHVLLSLSLLSISLACREDGESPAAPDTPPALATTASTLVFAQVSAGWQHTCGVTSDNRLFCWGWNADGELGDGTTTDRLVPVPVGGTLRFRQVSAGFSSTCAVTTDNRAYCWGFNGLGELGDGTTSPRRTPVPVAGGRQFRRVDISLEHACAVTTGDRAFCWGDNRYGQLGVGNNTGPETGNFGPHSSKPVAVAGTLTFRHVTAGFDHSCGVTTDNRVFCWGYNRYGQVGDSSAGWLKFKPVRVAGTRQYRQVDAGREYTCAVTTGDRAFCWGHGSSGQLGNGTESTSRWPRPVSGGLSFERVSAGLFHTCAETTANRAYCWGAHGGGNLGDGTFSDTDQLTPVAVVGGLLFGQVSAGGHSCGRTPEGVGYCWGRGFKGELGTGTTGNIPTPVPVADPM
jgi:alpha-tubulin suppressor-like RCC1 family protein